MLEEIVAAHRRAAAADSRPLPELLDAAENARPPRDFASALHRPGALSVIAEIKRRSPSAGSLAPDLDPATIARDYEAGGAAALSVLTDSDYFGGSPGDLQAARAAVSLPVMRKDFTVGAADVCDARLMGADAILLIAAALDDAELSDLHALATSLALTALVEVHDEAELERAVSAGATVIGVNSRDLRTFSVDLAVAERLAPRIPDHVVKVAESGVKTPDDARRLAGCGYDAVLVGTSIVTADDPASRLRALVS